MRVSPEVLDLASRKSPQFRARIELLLHQPDHLWRHQPPARPCTSQAATSPEAAGPQARLPGAKTATPSINMRPPAE
ncbi:hypothetical protein ABZ912_52505 [Nonomuraea angiospora]|uniref:hypothetical protein n=1 Tax=Nonomuraea angiospora TaxID=46172 RepID=UPI0033ED7C3A